MTAHGTTGYSPLAGFRRHSHGQRNSFVAAWRATSYYNSVGHFLALKNHPSRHVFAGGAYFAAARLPSFRLSWQKSRRAFVSALRFGVRSIHYQLEGYRRPRRTDSVLVWLLHKRRPTVAEATTIAPLVATRVQRRRARHRSRPQNGRRKRPPPSPLSEAWLSEAASVHLTPAEALAASMPNLFSAQTSIIGGK